MEYENIGGRSNRKATNIISEIVRPGRQNDFEKWSKGINQVVSQQPGFVGLDVLRPRDPSHLEYIIIIRFEDADTLDSWLGSETFREMFAAAEPFLLSSRSQQQSHGLEQWFDLPQHQIQAINKPTFFKLVITGVLAVYPLVVIANLFVNPVTKGLPYPVSVLISVVFISLLMTYPMMPLISKILGPWLYPVSHK